MLERALRLEPRMADARLLRASTRLTRGDFAAARADCAVLIGQGETFAGSACLAQSLAAMGSIAAAGALLGRALEPCARPSAMAAAATTVGVAADAALCAWALGIRADLAQRRGDSAAAERDLRAALQRDARSELLRIQLAQLLMARGAADQAATWLDVPYPSVAMQVQRLALLDPNQAGHAALRAQVEAQLALGRARGERLHLREETQLALDIDHDMPRALALARANFAVQRELVDVRMLARAATGARDAAALRELADWTRGWGYADVVVQRMLASGGA